MKHINKDIEFATIKSKKYKRLVEDECNVHHFITFRYMIPFRIPVSNGSIFHIENFMFHCIQKTYPFYGLNDGFGVPEIKNTVLEVTNVLKIRKYKKYKNEVKKFDIDEKELTKIFDKQLELLNDFLENIIIYAQYHSLYNVDKSSLLGQPVFKQYTWDGKKFKIDDTNMFIIKLFDKIVGDTLTDLKIKEIDNIMNNFYSIKNHSLKQATIFFRKGERFLFNYDFNSSIVNNQTGFEVFIVLFVKKYYEITKIKNETQIINVLESGFKNIFKDHFLKTLYNISSDLNEEIEEISKYYLEECYNLRNEIVHAGKVYSEKEAKQFKDCVSDFIYIINQKLKKEKNDEFAKWFSSISINKEKRDIHEILEYYKEKNS